MKFYVFNTFSDKVSVKYSLSLGLLNTEQKPLVKKKRVSTAVDFKFYRSRVEKILTGSTSVTHHGCHNVRACLIIQSKCFLMSNALEYFLLLILSKLPT